MTLPGAPCLYYGDEVGMEGGLDPDCRESFPEEASAWDHHRRAFVRGAIHLRRDNPVLRRGRTRVLGANDSAMAYLRSDDASAAFVVALNAGEAAASLVVDVPEMSGRTATVVSWEGWRPDAGPLPHIDGAGRLSLIVPARDALVVRLDPSRG